MILKILKDLNNISWHKFCYFTTTTWLDILEDVLYKFRLLLYPFYFIKTSIVLLYRITKNREWNKVITKYKEIKE